MVDTNGNVNLAAVRTYANANGDTPFVPVVSAQNFSVVNARLEAVTETIKVLGKFVADNPGHLRAPALAVAINRAKLGQAHYQAQLTATTAGCS